MPIINQLSETVEISKTASGGLSAENSAAVDSSSQAQLASPSLQPISSPPGMISVIPFGVPIAMILLKMESLLFKSSEDLSALSQQLMDKYNADKEKALTKRTIALTKLNQDLLTEQENIKTDLQELINELEEINTKLPELKTYQTSEMEKYLVIIFEIKDRAKKQEELGLLNERDIILEEIKIHDNWLGEIIKISVEIITLELSIPSLEREIEDKEYLANVSIPKNWEKDVELADSFLVAVPSYPDLPSPPELPTAPPIPQQNELVKAMKKAFALWLVTPTIPPFGIPIAGMLLYIQASSQAAAPLASKLEAAAGASILQGAGLF